VGDLIATCTSTLSRNHTVGRRLAGGETLAQIQADMVMVAEGVNTTEAVHRHAKRLGVDMPIAEGMYDILFQGAAIPDVLDSLMLRTSLYEAIDAPIHLDVNATPSITEHAAALAARTRPVA
jgi:glycerol-3-phosphate dehydrogenase (NAD(P)+)